MNNLKELIDEAKYLKEEVFPKDEHWFFDDQYGVPYLRVALHSRIHLIILKLAEIKVDEK